MKTQHESVDVPKAIRTMRDDVRHNDPRLRTIHDLQFRDVLIAHSKSTR
jgi:hypothetical protein